MITSDCIPEQINIVSNIKYADAVRLKQVQEILKQMLPLIKASEINELRHIMSKINQSNAFVIQLGDCAERFSDACESVTKSKCMQLIKLKELMHSKLNRQIHVIGRIAGQYAKPRSKPFEIVNNRPTLAYFGDLINHEHDVEARNPDPERLLTAYNSASKILSCLYACNDQLFTSHECFLLEYELPLTRNVDGKLYSFSTHFPWLGMRNINSKVHIQYLSKIHNPVAIKVGPGTHISTIISSIASINPDNDVGKIIVILRLGIENVKTHLPKLIEELTKKNMEVVWMCDPMHGNTKADKYGLKYRLLSSMIEETLEVIFVLSAYGLKLKGVHLEATYKSDVLECITSLDQLLPNRPYDSALDPRLNHEQCEYYLEKIMNYL